MTIDVPVLSRSHRTGPTSSTDPIDREELNSAARVRDWPKDHDRQVYVKFEYRAVRRVEARPQATRSIRDLQGQVTVRVYGVFVHELRTSVRNVIHGMKLDTFTPPEQLPERKEEMA